MAGKYEHVTKTLPKFLIEDPHFRERVNKRAAELREALAGRPASALASEYRMARLRKKHFDRKKKALNVDLKALEQLLVDRYENEGIKSVTLDNGGKVRVQQEPRAKVVDKAAFRAWCVANGYEEVMNLAWGTTNGIVKEYLLSGQALPPGVEAKTLDKFVYSKGDEDDGEDIFSGGPAYLYDEDADPDSAEEPHDLDD